MSETTTISEIQEPSTPPRDDLTDQRQSEESIRTNKEIRRYSKRLALILGAVIICAACLFLWHYWSGFESTDDAQVDVHLYPVSARITGYIQKVDVRDNQYVQKGATLVEIDPTDYRVAVDRARAELANAEAVARALTIRVPVVSVDASSKLDYTTSAIESAKAGVVAAQKEAAAAHARVLEAEAQKVKGQDDVRRYRLLLTKDEVPRQVYDHAFATAATDSAAVAAAQAAEAATQQEVQQAEERLMQAKANFHSAETGPQRVASTRSQALAARADVQLKQAVVEQAELNLRYTKILAPVSGQVNKKVVAGMNVEPGEQLLTIVPLDQVWITANFKETQLKHMRREQKVEISVDSTGRTYKGRVDSIAGATGPLFSLLPPENATGNYVKIVQRLPVKIVLDPGENRDHTLRPGMNVEAKVNVR
jgi:membrane fusion protein, multidrug efflux system